MIALEVTPGELLDRLTILELKLRRRPPRDPQAQLAARVLKRTREAWRRFGVNPARLGPRLRELRAINRSLWNAENEIRAREQQQDFGEGFVSVARTICRLNDRRSTVKRAIDVLCGSPRLEEKRYGVARVVPATTLRKR